MKSVSFRLQERSNTGSQGALNRNELEFVTEKETVLNNYKECPLKGEFQEAKIEDACGSYPDFGDGVVEDEFLGTTMYDNIREMHDQIGDSVLQTVDGGTPKEPGRSSKL